MVENQDPISERLNRYIIRLKGAIQVTRVILFGSHARGEALKTSDVDLVVISPDFRGMDFLTRLELLSRFFEPGLDADILGYTPEEFEEASQRLTLLAEVKRTGRDIPLP